MHAGVQARFLGRVAYDRGLELQDRLVSERRRDVVPDQLLLLEHDHVITLGSSAREDHVLVEEGERERLGVALFETGRGGDVTYHGPGQLVGYPIMRLTGDRRDLHRYLRDLEEVLIRVVGGFGIRGERSEGFTGVWTPGGKIAAIGVRVSSGWITSHGFALNVHTDLSFFDRIVPCGIHERAVTSLERELGRRLSLQEVIPSVRDAFESVFEAPVRMEGAPEFMR
jgi:lipoyl(octanoyl) transferase